MLITQLTEPQIACPFQSLHITTNVLHFTDGSEMLPKMSSVNFGDKETSIVMNVTGLSARGKFYSNFSILSQDGDVVDTESTHFSKQSKEKSLC